MAAASLRTETGDAAAVGNRLLQSLPSAERRLVLARLELVELKADEVLQRGGSGAYAYFPLDCVVAVGLVERLTGIDLIAAGNEGMIGLDAVLGSPADRRWAVCRIGGRCLRIEASVLAGSLAEWPVLQVRMRRYADAMTSLLLQRVLCGRLHPQVPRCASWLLRTSDQVGGPSFSLTHAVLAGMLGVRRATVSASAAELQQTGLISYSRGRVMILDRVGLERVACPCYSAVRDMFDAVAA